MSMYMHVQNVYPLVGSDVGHAHFILSILCRNTTPLVVCRSSERPYLFADYSGYSLTLIELVFPCVWRDPAIAIYCVIRTPVCSLYMVSLAEWVEGAYIMPYRGR